MHPVEPAGATQVLFSRFTAQNNGATTSFFLVRVVHDSNGFSTFFFFSRGRGRGISLPPRGSFLCASTYLNFVLRLDCACSIYNACLKFGASLVKPGGRPRRPLSPTWWQPWNQRKEQRRREFRSVSTSWPSISSRTEMGNGGSHR